MDCDEFPLSLVGWLLHWGCLESIEAWAQCALILEMPRRDAIVFPAEESVLTMILTSLERIADLNSWMKCLIASDSTDAWVIACSSASADECDTDACVLLVDALLTDNIVIAEPLVDLLDFWHTTNLDLGGWRSRPEWVPENLELEPAGPRRRLNLWSDWHTWEDAWGSRSLIPGNLTTILTTSWLGARCHLWVDASKEASQLLPERVKDLSDHAWSDPLLEQAESWHHVWWLWTWCRRVSTNSQWFFLRTLHSDRPDLRFLMILPKNFTGCLRLNTF